LAAAQTMTSLLRQYKHSIQTASTIAMPLLAPLCPFVIILQTKGLPSWANPISVMLC